MTKVRVLARVIRTSRKDGQRVTLRRGDVVDLDQFETAVANHLFVQLVPKDGSAATKRLLAEHGKEYREASKDGKKNWRVPAWFESSLMPAIDIVHHSVPLRDSHGRFKKES